MRARRTDGAKEPSGPIIRASRANFPASTGRRHDRTRDAHIASRNPLIKGRRPDMNSPDLTLEWRSLAVRQVCDSDDRSHALRIIALNITDKSLIEDASIRVTKSTRHPVHSAATFAIGPRGNFYSGTPDRMRGGTVSLQFSALRDLPAIWRNSYVSINSPDGEA